MVLDNKITLIIMNYFLISYIFHLLVFKYHIGDIQKEDLFDFFLEFNMVRHIINEINDCNSFKLLSFDLAYLLIDYKFSKPHLKHFIVIIFLKNLMLFIKYQSTLKLI